jgi:hypothetical protein
MERLRHGGGFELGVQAHRQHGGGNKPARDNKTF